MKLLFTAALTLTTFLCFGQVLNTTEGEIQSTTLSGVGDRNVVANANGVLRIGAPDISTLYFSPDRAHAIDELLVPFVVQGRIRIVRYNSPGAIFIGTDQFPPVTESDEVWVAFPLDLPKSYLQSFSFCYNTSEDLSDGQNIYIDRIQVVTKSHPPNSSGFNTDNLILDADTSTSNPLNSAACEFFVLPHEKLIEQSTHLKFKLVMGEFDHFRFGEISVNIRELN